jgi:exodeoxyribonuclease-5
MENGKYELFPGIYANKGQTEALDMLYDFLKSDEIPFVLRGRGGTGKTTIIKKMIENYPGNIGGMAISHKAKKMLGLSIGKENVMTLASALCIKLDENTGQFTPDEYKRKDPKNIPITKLKLILVDEASQISKSIIAEIKKFKTSGAKIIFIGDDAQLPPIGESNISSVFKIKNSYTLLEKMRQAATSPIINIGEIVAKNGLSESPLLHALSEEHRVNKYDDESGSEVLFESNEEKVLDMFAEDFKNANGNVDYCKMVTFNNHLHKSSQSVKSLNTKIRKKN